MIPGRYSKAHRTRRRAPDPVSTNTAVDRSVRGVPREAGRRLLYRTCGQVDQVWSSCFVRRYSERIQVAKTADRIVGTRVRSRPPFPGLQRALDLLAKSRGIACFKKPHVSRAGPHVAGDNGDTQGDSFTNRDGIAIAKRRPDECIRSRHQRKAEVVI